MNQDSFNLQNKAKPTSHKKALDMISKQQSNASYNKVMQVTREHLDSPSRILSSVIHANFIDKTIESLSRTVLRPNALLFGSILVLVATLVSFFYVFSYGYAVSNLEIILSFAIGWLLGLVYDYLRILVSGK